MVGQAALRAGFLGACLASAALLAGCDAPPGSQAPGDPRAQGAAAEAPVCAATGAHAAHGRFACQACHPCGGALGFDAPVVLPGGTTTAGGTVVRDATGVTCSVGCHAPKGAPPTTITWAAPGPLACTSCHAPSSLPPAHTPVLATAPREYCLMCHDHSQHTSGTVVVTGHDAAWSQPDSPGFHAYSANRGVAACTACHGAQLDGGAARGCTACHGANFATRCTSCHGGADLDNGAPPRPTWGGAGDARRVGAHTRHLAGGTIARAMACGECHAVPADPFSPAHVDGAVQVAFAGPVGGAAGGSWNYPVTGAPTCSSTYCHGNFIRGNVANAPSWTAAGPAACGSCHASRPVSYLHRRHARDYGSSGIPWWPQAGGSVFVTCGDCHAGIAQSVNGTAVPTLTATGGLAPALHVDGKVDVVFRTGGTYVRYPAEGLCSSMECHPGETKSWPR